MSINSKKKNYYISELGQETIDALLIANKIPDHLKDIIFDDAISLPDVKKRLIKNKLIKTIEEMIKRKAELKKYGFFINHQAIDFSCDAIVNAGNKIINADNFGHVGGISRDIHDYFEITESDGARKSPLASLLEIEAKINTTYTVTEPGGKIQLNDGEAMILSLDSSSADLNTDQKTLLAKKKPKVNFADCKYLIHAVGPDCADSEYKIDASDDIFTQKIKKTKRKKALYLAYMNSLRLAHNKGCRSIHLPFISIGIFGYPKEEFARVVAKALYDFKNENPQAFSGGIKISVKDPRNNTINRAIELLEKELLELYQKKERISKISPQYQDPKLKSSSSLKRASAFLHDGKTLNTYSLPENISETFSQIKFQGRQIGSLKFSSRIPTNLVMIGKLAYSSEIKDKKFRSNPRVAMAIERSSIEGGDKVSNVAKLIFQRQYDIAKDTATQCLNDLKTELQIFQDLSKEDGENDEKFSLKKQHIDKKNLELLENLLELAQSVAKENEGISRQGKSESAKKIISEKLAIKPLVVNSQKLNAEKVFEIIAKISVEFQRQALNKKTFSGNFQADNYQQVGFSLKRVDKECFVRGFMDGVKEILARGVGNAPIGAGGR